MNDVIKPEWLKNEQAIAIVELTKMQVSPPILPNHEFMTEGGMLGFVLEGVLVEYEASSAVDVLMPGEVFCPDESGRLVGVRHWPAHVAYIPDGRIQNTDVWRLIVEGAGRKLARTRRLLRMNQETRVDTRISQMLDLLAIKDGDRRIVPMLFHSQFAELSGMRHETFGRTFKQMREVGIVKQVHEGYQLAADIDMNAAF